MKILYVYAHPQSHSFNALLKQRALNVLEQQGHQVVLSDLYAENFQAVASWQDFQAVQSELPTQYFLAQQAAYEQHLLVPDIEREINKIREAEHLILQFPLWWFSVPAILKGWFDRVLVKGFAYDSGKVFADGLLKGKTAALVITTQSPEEAYQITGLHGAAISDFLRPVYHMLRFVGIEVLSPFVTYAAIQLDAARSDKLQKDYDQYLIQLSR